MASETYQSLYSTLINSEKDTGNRYLAALELSKSVEESNETAELVAKDLGNILQMFKGIREMTLSQAIFELLYHLTYKKGLTDEFLAAKFPSFCAEYVEKENFRLKSSHMVLNLLRDNGMVKEMVSEGIIDLLLRYADYIDKDALPQRPHLILKIRRFVFLSLLSISENKDFVNLLIEKRVLEKVKLHSLKLNLADELARLLPGPLVGEIRKDENVLHASGLDILFNLSGKFENYKRKDTTIRTEEVKYLYDYDSDHEATTKTEEGRAVMSAKKKEQWNNAFSDQDDSKSYKNLLQQISEFRLVEDVLEACIQLHPTPSLHGLRILYRLCSVIHLFLTVEFRVAIVNSLLGIATKISGQRRHNCFSCLLVLSRHVENSSMFVSTSVFRTLFFIGMEESGEVLNQLLKVLRSLSVHTSTAEEMAVRSECPKLLVKVIAEDFKGLIEYSNDAKDEEKDVAIDKSPAICLLTLFNLIQNSRECKEAIVNSGAMNVFATIAKDHPKDIMGMMALTSIASLSARPKINKIPIVTQSMVEILFDALSCCLDEKPYEMLLFPAREICLCLESLSRQKRNAKFLTRGFPLYVRVLHTYVSDFANKGEQKISGRTVQYISKVLQELSLNKIVLNKMIELGEPFLELLQEAEGYISEATTDSIFEDDNDAALRLQYLQLAISDEISVIRAREDNDDSMRKSSCIDWGKILSEKASLIDFMNLSRFEHNFF